MRISIVLTAALLLASASQAAETTAPRGTLLFLHYRWVRDSLTLVESKRIPAKVKPSRLAANRARRVAGNAPADIADRTEHGPRSGFSYNLIGAEGEDLGTRFLDEPGLRRVEFQEKGDPTLRSQEMRVDTSDIFLRIPEPDAKRIRFHRHRKPEPRGLATSGSHADQGPEAPTTKIQVAEFPLE